MQDFVRDFKQTLELAERRLREVSETRSEVRPALGEWSAKEILGHLIDSAANNHRRFVEAQSKDDLVFPGYSQKQWVAVQQYQQASWTAHRAVESVQRTLGPRGVVDSRRRADPASKPAYPGQNHISHSEQR